MILSRRLDLMTELGDYMRSDGIEWKDAKRKAYLENGWFIPEFINLATENIAKHFLQRDNLIRWTAYYEEAAENSGDRAFKPLTVGLVMAGNIPLVGFHDFLSVYISGHKAMLKPSSKDSVLIRHLVDVLVRLDSEVKQWVTFADMLKNCDAYIATGSNNTSRYFEYYFSKYPHIIRQNKTSVAILQGNETDDDLDKLADDVYQFFGLGCRNVTKIYVPVQYNFQPLLASFEKYNYLADHHKYKNNYDHNLALHILHKRFYMTNGSVMLVEDKSIFSPISQLNYEYYDDRNGLLASLLDNKEIQCIVGDGHVPFGKAQSPGLFDYADNVDTMAFLHFI